MSKFGKSNSGRFGGGSKSSGGSRFGGGSKSSGGSRGGYSRNSGGGGGGRGGDNAFVRVGSLTVSKKVVEEQGDDVIQQLKDSGLQLWLNFYLPKGTNSMTITNNTKVLISLKEVKNAPEFIVGVAQVSNDSE